MIRLFPTLAIPVLLIAAGGAALAPDAAPDGSAESSFVAHPDVTTAAPVRDGNWGWPVLGDHRIVRPFIAPTSTYSAGHRGIDIEATGNVLAPTDGIVHFRGFVVDRPLLSIAQTGGQLTSYEPVESTLNIGDRVTRGQVIGTLVAGHCAALCLHFGVRVNGEYVNPMLFLGGVTRPVLLPTRSIATAPRAQRAVVVAKVPPVVHWLTRADVPCCNSP